MDRFNLHFKMMSTPLVYYLFYLRKIQTNPLYKRVFFTGQKYYDTSTILLILRENL